MPSKRKCEAILAIHRPMNVSEVDPFLETAQHYSSHISNSSIAAPLFQLKKKDFPFHWSHAREGSFNHIKEDLQSPSLLTHFNDSLPNGLATDASQKGLGEVLFHVFPAGPDFTINFASRTLVAAERNYSQLEKESLRIILAQEIS